jgi:hypothetical protein
MRMDAIRMDVAGILTLRAEKAILGRRGGGEMRIAVGTPVARHNPHKAVRAAFPHTASTLGI